MKSYDYDLFVIGGGSGGVRAARIAAQYGARVAIAEEYRFGGTCVIRGCVPKKLFVYASRFSDAFDDAAGFGWDNISTAFNWSKLVEKKDQEILRLENIYRGNLDKAGVECFDSRAELEGTNKVRLINYNKCVTADKILIATGGIVNLDSKLPGIEHVISSNEAFDLKDLPKRIIVVGGGYIAVEFAGIFAGLGVETTLVCRGDKILRGFDEDIQDALTKAYQHRGVKIFCNSTLKSIKKTYTGLQSILSKGELLESDQVMFAIGRKPKTGGMGLEKAGVELGSRGEIKVNPQSQTNIHNIYAVGDVTDRLSLTPVAIREGHAFSDTVFGNMPCTVDYEMIPTAIFSTPEVATVGMSEHKARMTFAKLDVYKSSFRPMRATISGREERMLMKLLVNASDQRVVGCHVLGDAASEIIQMAAVALRMGATKSDLDNTMALHPSASEELVTMRNKWSPKN